MSTHSLQKTADSPVETNLPGVILNYIAAANDGRIDDAAACFTECAHVHDENNDHRGIEAVRKWIADATREFQPKNEVLSATEEGEAHTVISKISGNFPGSPIDLEFRFLLAHGKISQLSIR